VRENFKDTRREKKARNLEEQKIKRDSEYKSYEIGT
jgi:hypothetical protein